MTRLMLAAWTLLGLGAVATACDRCAPAAPTTPAARAPQLPPVKETPKVRETERMKQNREKAQEVFQKLLKADPDLEKNWPKNLTYPPVFEVVEYFSRTDENGREQRDYLNAAADRKNDGKRYTLTADGKFISVVLFTYDYLELLGGDEHGIALVMGHELGHHVLGHTTRFPSEKPFMLAMVDGHRREADADLYGARLMLKANYSVGRGVVAEWKGWERRGGISASANVVCATHPADSDRAMRLYALLEDKEREEFWRHMVDFENGSAFLAHGHYAAAEACFNRMIEKFPDCYEAHANLGLCKLLRYIAGLSTDDLRDMGVGHFLAAAYPTAGSVVPDRGGDSKLWFDAIKHLNKALGSKPDSPLILSNLALAYLVHPDGQDVGKSLEYTTQAEKAARKVNDLPTPTRITLLVNLGVARLAAGDTAQGKNLLAEATQRANRLYEKPTNWPANLRSAMAFNQGLADAGSDDNKAADQFLTFLELTPRSSPWWPVAYERYEKLCETTGRTPRPKDDFKRPGAFQTQLLVTLPGDKVIHLGQSLPKAIGLLGEPDGVVEQRSKLRRLKFAAHGIELLADNEEVFGITITSAGGPAIEVREANLTGHKIGELRVGMTRKQIEALLGGRGVNRLDFFGRELPYYPDLGVGVEYDKDGVAIRLIVSTMSETPFKRD